MQISTSVPADEYLSTFALNFINIFNQQRLWKEVILIPNLHKSPTVSSNANSPLETLLEKTIFHL
ncbi:MAG: hypothetical protein ABIR15_06635 [Chitinophagaceae bacterium]